MNLNQQGTVNNGQHGTIIAVYVWGGMFRADNGVEYTVLDDEFVGDNIASHNVRCYQQQAKIARMNRIEHPVTPRADLDRAFGRLSAEGFGAVHVTGIPQGFVAGGA